MDEKNLVDIPPHIRLLAEVTLLDTKGQYFTAILEFDKVPDEGNPLHQIHTLIGNVIAEYPEYRLPTKEDMSQRKKRAFIDELARALENAEFPIDPEQVN